MPGFDQLDRSRLRERPGAKWQRYGPDVLPLWVADMDFEPPPAVLRAIEDQMATGDLGYSMKPSPPPVAAAFASWMSRRHGWEVDPHDVMLTQDVIQALQTSIHLFSEPGGGVAIQTPIYPPFLASVTAMGRRLVDNPLRRGADGYELDVAGLRASLEAEPCSILLLCNPHNPTGRVFTIDELSSLAALAEEFDLTVISDEIHADLVFPGSTHTPFATLPGAAERTVTLNSATKSFNIAGLRCAVAHVSSGRLRDRFRSLPDHIFGGVNVFGARATEAVWTEGSQWLEGLMGHLLRMRELVVAGVGEFLPGAEIAAPEATYLSWIDCRGMDLPVEPSRFFLKEAGVALNPGPDFGSGGRGHVRLNFATSADIVTEAFGRIARALP